MTFLFYSVVVYSVMHDLVVSGGCVLGVFYVCLQLCGADVNVIILLYAGNSLRSTDFIFVKCNIEN